LLGWSGLVVNSQCAVYVSLTHLGNGLLLEDGFALEPRKTG